jgi:hypothetical protein
MHNEKGYVLVGILLVLCMLTLIGTAALKRANSELDCAANDLIHLQNVYAAEGGMIAGAEWAVAHDIWENTASDGTGSFSNHTFYDFNVEYWKDSLGNILTYNDPVSHLILPKLWIKSIGTHTRGGKSIVEGVWVMRPIFLMPETPLWVFDTIKGQGNVKVQADTGSGDRDEVWFSLTPVAPYTLPNKINCPDGDGCSWNTAPELFPTDEVRKRVKGAADYNGSTFPSDLVAASSPVKPVIIYINGDVTMNNSTIKSNTNTGNTEGFGILFIDGSAKINGNIKWNGLIVIRDSAEVGNGTADIEGALVAGHNTIPGQPSDGIIDVSLSGTIDINYNRDVLQNLLNKTKQPVCLAWKMN